MELEIWRRGWEEWQSATIEVADEYSVSFLPMRVRLWLHEQAPDNTVFQLLDHLSNHIPLLAVAMLIHLRESVKPEIAVATLLNAWRNLNVTSDNNVWFLWAGVIERYNQVLSQSLDGLLITIVVKRKMGDWYTAQKLAVQLIERSGSEGAFDAQLYGFVELTTLHRLQGEYTEAIHYLERAHSMNQRYFDEHIREKISIERLQIWLDTRQDAIASGFAGFEGDGSTSILQIEDIFSQSDFLACRQLAEQRLNRRAISNEHTAFLLSLVGRCHLHENNLPDAIDWLSGALTIAERLTQAYIIGRAESNLGSALARLHTSAALEEAELLLKRAESRQQQIGDVVGLNGTHHNLRYVQQQKSILTNSGDTL